MKFILKPSLEHMALLKIVISLWNKNFVDLMLMVKLGIPNGLSPKSEEWKKIEHKVIEKVPQISLPQRLEEKVLGFIKPIGLQILKWTEFHCTRFNLHVNLPVKLCWTSHGTIDRKETAELLVKDENLDISTRYKLACSYCLEDDIRKLWSSIPEDLKETSISYTFPMISYWSHIMKKKGIPYTAYKDQFYECTKWEYKEAAGYFLKKLTPRERKESLLKIAKEVTYFDTLFFLISEMDEDQQIEIFKTNPLRVLQCFLQWPLQSFFIGIANCMWNFLSKNKYDTVLREIIDKSADGFKDWNYQNLFRDFFQESPDSLRSLITNEFNKSRTLSSLFHIKDKENVTLILKDATLTGKEKLIYSDEMNYFCQRFIRDNEWDFLEFLIRECLASKDALLKFKEAFEKRKLSLYLKKHLAENKQKWDQLFCLSNDSICKYDKRTADEDENSSSKRFCNQK